MEVHSISIFEEKDKPFTIDFVGGGYYYGFRLNTSLCVYFVGLNRLKEFRDGLSKLIEEEESKVENTKQNETKPVTDELENLPEVEEEDDETEYDDLEEVDEDEEIPDEDVEEEEEETEDKTEIKLPE